MPRRDPAAVAISIAAVLFLSLWRLRGPAPRETGALAAEFSANRAVGALQGLLREDLPHPAGSPFHATVRDRILTRFRALGYRAEVQRTFVCNAARTCATVENLIGRPAGMVARPVLLVAHYDSVAAGPGVSDDGVGVAVLLEIARAVRGDARIAFLLTDAEEAGLLGAEAFVRDRPLQPAVVVNVENRGTSGPSYLFETSRGNRDLIRAAHAIPRPVTTSLFFTVYDKLPNDTDVTVFKRAGVPAVNFAAIGGVQWYHTPHDDLRHFSARSMQHHGDNALAIARALAAKPPRDSDTNSTWFDLLGLTIVSWPQEWTVWIAVAGLVIVVARRPRKGYLGGLIAFAATLATATVLAIGLTFVCRANWIAYPQFIIAAMWLTGIGSALLFTGIGEEEHRYTGYSAAWLSAAIVLALTLPGASYMLLGPAVLFAVTWVPAVWAAAAAILILPYAIVLYGAMGRLGLIATAVLVAIVATTAAPLFKRSRKLAAWLFGAAIVCAAITALLPVHSASNPKRESLTHELPQPTIDIEARRSGNRVVISLRSRRNADQVSVSLPEGAFVERVNGIVPAPRNPRGRARTNAAVIYGRTAIVEVRAPRKIEIIARDLTYGVPAVVAARRGRNAVPSQRGDVTISTRTVTQ